MIPPVVGPLATHPGTGVGAPMSYAAQWSTGVGPHCISPNQVAAQGEILHSQNNMGPNSLLYNAYNSSNIRQHAPPLHLPVNQPSPTQSSGGFCPAPLPSGYSLLNPALLAAFAAQPNVTHSRAPNFYIQQGSTQPGAVRGTLLSSHGFQLAHAGSHTVSPGTMGINQQPAIPSPFHYIPTPNGLHLAAFSGNINSSHAANTSLCSFTPAAAIQHASQQQQQPGTMAGVQFRSYDSLKHFGALPQPQSHKRNKSMTTSKTNLYISGLSESDTDETVRALVEDVVRPKSCKAMLLNGKCKGSGFIDCATEDDAIKALNHLSEIAKNGGRKLNVKYALENEKDLLNVYVRNLPRTGFTKGTLENLFSPYGQVTSVKLLETDGAYTGIGFVRFASADQAQCAVENMNEARCVLVDSSNGGSGNGKPICCKLADKADPKRRAVNAAMAMAAASGSVAASQSAGVLSGSSRGPMKHSIGDTHQAPIPGVHMQPHQHAQQQVPNLIFQSGVLTDNAIMSVPIGSVPYQGMATQLHTGYPHHRQTNTDLALAAGYSIPSASCSSTASLPPVPSCFSASRGGLLETPSGSVTHVLDHNLLNGAAIPHPTSTPVLLPNGDVAMDSRFQLPQQQQLSPSNAAAAQFTRLAASNSSQMQGQTPYNYSNQYMNLSLQQGSIACSQGLAHPPLAESNQNLAAVYSVTSPTDAAATSLAADSSAPGDTGAVGILASELQGLTMHSDETNAVVTGPQQLTSVTEWSSAVVSTSPAFTTVTGSDENNLIYSIYPDVNMDTYEFKVTEASSVFPDGSEVFSVETPVDDAKSQLVDPTKPIINERDTTVVLKSAETMSKPIAESAATVLIDVERSPSRSRVTSATSRSTASSNSRHPQKSSGKQSRRSNSSTRDADAKSMQQTRSSGKPDSPREKPISEASSSLQESTSSTAVCSTPFISFPT